jgi:hypothetical protein
MLGQRASIASALLLAGAPLEQAEAEARLEPDEPSRLSVLPLVLYRQGKAKEADALLAQFERDYADIAATLIAQVHVWKGEPDTAFRWLERGRSQGEAFLNSVPFDGLFDQLHADPRWRPFLRSIGRAPEQLAHYRFSVKSPEVAPGR